MVWSYWLYLKLLIQYHDIWVEVRKSLLVGRKKNQKLWNQLTKNLNDFEILAGWFENTKYDDGTSIGFIARVQNNGAYINVTDKQRAFLHYLGIHLKDSTGQIIIPPRPFMDNAKDRVKKEGHLILMQEILRVFEGRQSMEQATNRLGIWLQGIIQEEIIKINNPKLLLLLIMIIIVLVGNI